MSINREITSKARIIPTQNTFSASFSLGVYDFGVAANTNQVVFNLDANSVYFLDRFSIAGNIASEDFLSCISTVPLLTLGRKNDNQLIYTRSFPITQFYDNKDCSCFVESNKGTDALVVSITGVLNQNINLVGVDPIILTLSFSCYAIDDRDYNRNFRDSINYQRM